MRRRVAVIVVVVGVAALAACSSGSSHPASSQVTTTSTSSTAAGATSSTAPATKDPRVWLCKPGLAADPCLSSMTTTVVAPDGTKTVQQAAAAPDPKIDCFYVYPTVSAQTTVNANLTIDPAEVSVAKAQASRYSQVCRVFAPMYRQVTLAGLYKRTANAGVIAFSDVLSAWNDYLARYNDGRGVVLIGHSQGSSILRPLISRYIDPNPSLRSRVVSAILLGGNVLVPIGKDVGGDFQHLPACHSASQLGCVIAFSSFDHAPPANSLFGRTTKAGDRVLCTNPAALAGGSGALDPYLPGAPWVSYPDLFTGQCEYSGGASWLQITDIRKPGDTRPKLVDSLGPTWGLHLYDGNIALGNLVDIVRSEAAAYVAHG